MQISEKFYGIQGEAKYTGYPAIFIRVSGCNLNCPWCDTTYHKNGYEETIEEISDFINNSEIKTVVWTGGEPMLQIEDILKVINYSKLKNHTLETNGTLLPPGALCQFDYIAFSPKNEKDSKEVYNLMKDKYIKYDIKIVTDLEDVGVDSLKYATMLMPLTTHNKKKDIEIKRKVWDYCLKHNLKYTPRIQVDLWGKKRGK